MKTILFFLFFLFSQNAIFSQKNNAPVLRSGISVIARAYGDSIVLRWAPQQAWAWHKLNIIGYRIERIDISEKDNLRREWLTTVALKPWPLEKIKSSFTSNNN